MNSWKEKYQNIMQKCSFTQNYSEPSTPYTTGKSEVLYVFVISGVIGFLAALLGRVTWQVSVESAQVASGIVQYTNKSPFYLYHTKVWSLLIQIPAFFLYLGVSERTLSIAISGIAGAFSFQALSLIIYAVSSKKLLALLSPMFIYITGMTSAFEGNYPIYLMGATHTYGMIGLSFPILALALVSLRADKIGWILIGIAPAVHLVLGTAALLVAIVIVIAVRQLSYIKILLPYLVSGILLAVFSYLYHLMVIYDVPVVDKEISNKYVLAFMQYWDFPHRSGSVSVLSGAMLMNAIVILLSAPVFIRNKISQGIQSSGGFLFKAFFITGILGIFFSMLCLIPSHYLPVEIIGAMPTRLLNFALFGAPPLFIGLLSVQRKTILSRSLLIILIVIPLVWYGVARNMDIVRPLIIFISVALIILMLKSSNGIVKRNQHTASIRRNLSALLNIAVIVILAAVLTAGLMKGVLQAKERFSMLTDWNNDRVYAEASKAKGILLTALEIRLVQLRTRRPVLLDALNQIPYVPESSEQINNILQKIYGLNILYPPLGDGDVVHATTLVNINKNVWENYTYNDWLSIAGEFGVSDVIVYKEWQLRLPVVADNDMYRMYRIESN